MTGFRFRYDFPLGQRFTIAASTHERIDVGGRPLVDLRASFSLDCEVACLYDQGAELRGVFERPNVTGHAPAGLIPDLPSLQGTELTVHKGFDGHIHSVEGAGAVEAIFGGLTLGNALTWFAAQFPQHSVKRGDEWDVVDEWRLDAARTPLGVSLPVNPVALVRYTYRAAGDRSLDVSLVFSGSVTSEPLGIELVTSGTGAGTVEVDREAGKLASSRKWCDVTLGAVPLRRGCLALPPLRVRRESDAGFKPYGWERSSVTSWERNSPPP